MKERFKYKISPALLCLVAVVIDRISKILVVHNLRVGESVPLIENVLHFTFRTNTGAAFSLFDADGQRWIFLVASAIGILAMLAFLYFTKKQPALIRYPIAMMAGGGIGNMIDRLTTGGLLFLDGGVLDIYGCPVNMKGAVVDMIDVRLIHFAVFNVADSFVVVGACLFAIGALLEIRREKTL